MIRWPGGDAAEEKNSSRHAPPRGLTRLAGTIFFFCGCSWWVVLSKCSIALILIKRLDSISLHIYDLK